MSVRLVLPALALALLTPPAAQGGLYYSGEVLADLPAQWRGFLLDHRALRFVAVPPSPNAPTSLLRDQYREAAAKLEKAAGQRVLTADESADLGALYVRLGRPTKAVEVLRAAQRVHPEHFRTVANLGTAWQLQGDLGEAARTLQEAVRLAPPKLRPFEEYHLKLVRLRAKEGRDAQGLDDLFGVRYVGESGQPVAGKIAPVERKKLPADAVAIVQQLALWLPADGRLLWQLGELANAHGDARTAAAILDGCVTEFGMGSPDLRKRRQIYRAEADRIAKLPDAEHAKYKGDLVTRSPRPLVRKFDPSLLPAIRPDDVNALPWPVLTETTVAAPFKPKFMKYLEDLNGKRVALTGFMQPLGGDLEVTGFMLIEYPVGCWFCETPDPSGILFVALPRGKTTPVKRGLVKVEGKLKLNRTDPEEFLYTLEDARIGEAD